MSYSVYGNQPQAAVSPFLASEQARENPMAIEHGPAPQSPFAGNMSSAQIAERQAQSGGQTVGQQAAAPAGGGFWPAWLSPAAAPQAPAAAPGAGGNWPAWLPPTPQAQAPSAPAAHATPAGPNWIQRLFGHFSE
jgi:hypothetical protein